ncbi:MAG: hypothetical protein R2706_11780 [Acidimicrobiales bacterium]
MTPTPSPAEEADGLQKIDAAIRALAEPVRHAKSEVAAAQAEWQLLTPHHHLFTYEAEVAHLTDEWKSFRELCRSMEERIARRGRRPFGRSRTDKASLGRLRAQLAAVDVRLNVLESQRKASSVVAVLPSDVVFAGQNLRAAQEWLLTLERELAELESAREQLQQREAA